MSILAINPNVQSVLLAYPEHIQKKLAHVRQLILEVAEDISALDKLEETLKWGEPSYLLKGGSTIRFAWKAQRPDEYVMYFNCKTRLVDTFREFYGDVFHFEGNRAIIFQVNDEIAVAELKHCISLALRYHKLKHLPTLGV